MAFGSRPVAQNGSPRGATIAFRRPDTRAPKTALFLTVPFFCSGREGREWRGQRFGCAFGASKRRPGLARVRIDAEDEEFGCERAEVDGSIHQRFALFGRLRQHDLIVYAICIRDVTRGHKVHIDRLLDLVEQRLEGHYAALPYCARDATADPQPVASAPGQVEGRAKPLNGVDSGRRGKRRARLLACFKLNMPAGFADPSSG